MKTTNFKGFFLLSILLSVFLLSGCSWKKDEGPASSSSTTLIMKNNSSEETHLWTNGEGIDPSNKLAPGAERAHDINWGEAETASSIVITVYAGRSGATITSRTFKVDLSKVSFTVVYSGGALSSAK